MYVGGISKQGEPALGKKHGQIQIGRLVAAHHTAVVAFFHANKPLASITPASAQSECVRRRGAAIHQHASRAIGCLYAPHLYFPIWARGFYLI